MSDETISPERIAARRATHERELLAQRRWRIAVSAISAAFGLAYLYLLLIVRVMDPVYLLINLLGIVTGLCGIIVYRVYELPTILAELPRLSEHQRRINLAAIEPIRAELLGQVLPGLHLARNRQEAAALDDDELVHRLASLQRPDWPRIGRACLIAYIVGMSISVAALVLYRPEHGVSLIDRLQGKTAEIDRSWSPL